MPGVYAPGEFDLVGTIVGVVDRAQIIDGTRIRPGDAVLGLASSGLHTNGYSLARRVLEGQDLRRRTCRSGAAPGRGAAHAAPELSALRWRALRAVGIMIKGLAHITGGGLIDNPPRILPAGLLPCDWTGEAGPCRRSSG